VGSLSRCLDKLMTLSTSALRRDYVWVLTPFIPKFPYRAGPCPHVDIVNNEIMAVLRQPNRRCKVEFSPSATGQFDYKIFDICLQ